MTHNPTHRRGDVVLVLFPNSDLRTAKTRPALVVQANDLNTELPQVIVAMITSRMIRAGHPCRVVITRASPDWAQSGLLTESVIATDNIVTISESAVYRSIGSIHMADVDAALRHTLAL